MRREAIHFYLKFHYRPVEGPMQSELQMPIEIGTVFRVIYPGPSVPKQR